ncbi:MAG: hypothetical protein CL424_03310 [Acidimicrobiaceae bacterium]|nr:hypothetical protein [Acidimicrobiaceae bacterium]
MDSSSPASNPEPDEGDNRLREVSYERLDVLAADVMVRLVVPGGEFDEATLAALAEDPLYEEFPAVASGQVVDVDSFAGQGYAGMNALADELERLVAELNTIAG